MSRRKQKNSQRAQPRELLDELNSLRDLLGSDDVGDIPLLDKVAAPGEPAAAPAKPRAPEQTPLEEIDLPVLFSPVDEEPPEDLPELSESDRELLRPLQDLPGGVPEAKAPPPEPEEQQGELFDQPSTNAGKENPFLPAHIRERLTGGQVPRTEEQQPAPADNSPVPDEQLDAPRDTGAGDPTGPEAEAAEREHQRRQLIDRLVAKQLPELERQLRARIERMVDELEAKR